MIYDLILSKGQTIKIDQEDLEKIKANLSASLIQVKQGIFNPSFMVMIKPTDAPDVIEKPIMEIEGNTARQVGMEEVQALSDLMGGDIKKLK